MKIAYLFDSGSNYNLQNEKDCFVVPMSIDVHNEFGQKSFLDSVTITREELEKIINNNSIIKTSQPPIGYIIESIDSIYKEYDLIIAIPFSKHLSSTYNTILGLQKEYGKDKFLVANVNTMSITGNWFLDDLKEFISENKTITQLELDVLSERIVKKQCGIVIVADPSRLISGGRLKKLKGLIARTFKFKLIIKYKGNLEFVDKSISIKESIEKALKIIDQDCEFSKNKIRRCAILANLNNEEENQELTNFVIEKLKTTTKIEKAFLPGCVIAHTGTNTFSILIESN